MAPHITCIVAHVVLIMSQIIYRDGTIEPIFLYRAYDGYCEVVAPSGTYAYIETESRIGFIPYVKREFYYYDQNKHDWFIDRSIKEFQLCEEDVL